MEFKATLQRKVITGFLTIVSFAILSNIILLFELDGNQETDRFILLISALFVVTATTFYLLYGIPISMLIEYIFLKRGFSSTIGYIVLHTVLLSSISFFLFREEFGIVLNAILVVCSCMFACIDRLLANNKIVRERIVRIVVIPIVLLFILFLVILKVVF